MSESHMFVEPREPLTFEPDAEPVDALITAASQAVGELPSEKVDRAEKLEARAKERALADEERASRRGTPNGRQRPRQHDIIRQWNREENDAKLNHGHRLPERFFDPEGIITPHNRGIKREPLGANDCDMKRAEQPDASPEMPQRPYRYRDSRRVEVILPQAYKTPNPEALLDQVVDMQREAARRDKKQLERGRERVLTRVAPDNTWETDPRVNDHSITDDKAQKRGNAIDRVITNRRLERVQDEVGVRGSKRRKVLARAEAILIGRLVKESDGQER